VCKRKRGERLLPLLSDGNEEQEIERNYFLQHADTLLPLSTSEKKNDISATRKAAGKRTKIAVRFLYYFFNGLRLSKNASERDIAPFTPQRYNIPPTLSKHFPTLFPLFLPSPSASLLRPSASLFCQAISLFCQPAQ